MLPALFSALNLASRAATSRCSSADSSSAADAATAMSATTQTMRIMFLRRPVCNSTQFSCNVSRTNRRQGRLWNFSIKIDIGQDGETTSALVKRLFEQNTKTLQLP